LAPEVALIGLGGAVLGDSLSYTAGWIGRSWLSRRFLTPDAGRQAASGQRKNAWQQANQAFEKGGGMAVYLTRWLLTSMAIPTNLAAGGCGYRFDRFLLFDVCGEATWIVLFGGLGYWFGSQWELVQQFLSDFSGLALGLAVLGAGVYLAAKSFSRRRKPSFKEISNVYQNQPVY
jgi:membrane protein DedA with SNARE-associated domain